MDVKQAWDHNVDGTRYAPIYWTHDPYAPTDDPYGALGAVILLVNDGWVRHYEQSRWDGDVLHTGTIHRIALTVPAPYGITDALLDELTAWQDAWSVQEQEAFAHHNVPAYA